MGGFNIAKTAFTRVQIIEGRARPDHVPDFQSCMKAQSISQSFGDIEKIECPDPNRFGGFIEVGQIQGQIERATMDLMGRYASDIASELLRIAKKRCSTDVHINIGACSDPRNNNKFTKKIILEDAVLTNWNTEDLGALSSDENAVVNESTSLSIANVYEVLELSFSERGGDVVTNPVLDIVICDRASCGDCDDESDGCQIVYAVTANTPGSPGTAPDLLYSLDGGKTWAADDITSMLASEDANALACLGDYVYVVSEDSESLHYKLKSVLNAGTVANWTEIATGFVTNNGPLDTWSVGTYAFIVGEGGYVYGTANVTTGVAVLDAGVATSNNLQAVHAISDEFAVAVGVSDTIIYTKDRVTWTAATATGGGNGLTCVWIKNQDEWFVGDDAGNYYYTLDQGVTWAAITMPVTLSQINDTSFSSDSVGYISAENSTPRGIMLRTYDGGHSWLALPEGSGNLPLSDSFDAHSSCVDDVNFVVAGGLADDAADGVLILGLD
jgi:hypothetical protein